MPSQVPAGYTRGPILFLGDLTTPHSEELLLQYFWEQGGGYGGRILIIPASGSDLAAAEHYQATLNDWLENCAKTLYVSERSKAGDPAYIDDVARATAILILGQNSLRFASTFGGTPLAQEIRRANAQGKTVAGLGGCAAALCQHMIAFDTRQQMPRPYLHRHLIQFAPGLGIVNRLILDGVAGREDSAGDRISRLLTAIAYNPFAVGVSLEADTGIVVYPNSTLEVLGRNNAIIIDGSGLIETNLHEVGEQGAVSILGIRLHVLAHNYIFDIDQRTAKAPTPTDIPQPSDNAKAAF